MEFALRLLTAHELEDPYTPDEVVVVGVDETFDELSNVVGGTEVNNEDVRMRELEPADDVDDTMLEAPRELLREIDSVVELGTADESVDLLCSDENELDRVAERVLERTVDERTELDLDDDTVLERVLDRTLDVTGELSIKRPGAPACIVGIGLPGTHTSCCVIIVTLKGVMMNEDVM